MGDENGIRLTPEQQKSRRSRSIAIAAILFGLVLIFYLVTIVRLGGNIASRAL